MQPFLLPRCSNIEAFLSRVATSLTGKADFQPELEPYPLPSTDKWQTPDNGPRRMHEGHARDALT